MGAVTPTWRDDMEAIWGALTHLPLDSDFSRYEKAYDRIVERMELLERGVVRISELALEEHAERDRLQAIIEDWPVMMKGDR